MEMNEIKGKLSIVGTAGCDDFLEEVDGWLKDSRYVDANGKLIPSEIPIDETRNYVAKVQKSAEEYRQLYETVSQ